MKTNVRKNTQVKTGSIAKRIGEALFWGLFCSDFEHFKPVPVCSVPFVQHTLSSYSSCSSPLYLTCSKTEGDIW